MNNTIKAGDWVRVCWADGSYGNYNIIYIPCATGDCYKCLDKDGNPTNIMNFDVMQKINDPTIKEYYGNN